MLNLTRRNLFAVVVVLTLLVSLFGNVGQAMAVAVSSVTRGDCRSRYFGGGPNLYYYNYTVIIAPGDTVTVTGSSNFTFTGTGTQNWYYLPGTRTFTFVSTLSGNLGTFTITCPAPAANEPPPPPFWVTDTNGTNRIGADPGEKFAVYCFKGGWIDIWSTNPPKPVQFATTTFDALNSLANGGTTTINTMSGGTMKVSKDDTGKLITLSDGTDTRTFSLDACSTLVNAMDSSSLVNDPSKGTYTPKTSAAITNQLDAAKKALASAVDADAIAKAQAEVNRWESLYRSNTTVITENSDGSITFQFSDGTTSTVK